LDIYIFSLSGIDKGSLKTLFAELLCYYIIFLEDIDAASPTRSSDTEIKDFYQIVTGSPLQKDKATRRVVSLSALLNIINSIVLQEGRVLIITTNYIEYLDKVLIQPGYTDRKVEFRLADKEIMTQLFCIVFKYSESDVLVEENKTVEQLAKEFAAKVPKLEFSPAEILLFLLEYKYLPGEAVDNIGV
jgi:mitochondrial chaperone BCS1